MLPYKQLTLINEQYNRTATFPSFTIRSFELSVASRPRSLKNETSKISLKTQSFHMATLLAKPLSLFFVIFHDLIRNNFKRRFFFKYSSITSAFSAVCYLITLGYKVKFLVLSVISCRTHAFGCLVSLTHHLIVFHQHFNSQS